MRHLRGLAADLAPGDRVLIDDGRIELEVIGDRPARGAVTTRVVVGGPLAQPQGRQRARASRCGVDAITDDDRAALAWACGTDVDFIGQSFVRSAADVENLRALMTRPIPIVAKIEKHEAVAALDEIVAAADAVMVARGDLGVETSPEQVPVIQRRIIAAARAAGKPVVVATQMLDSMTHAPRPTRAEASDVANAIFDRADAVMLSGETAVGDYPVLVVETMGRIAKTAEEAIRGRRLRTRTARRPTCRRRSAPPSATSRRTCDLAAIVPVTQSGATALAVARHRPERRIVAVTPIAGGRAPPRARVGRARARDRLRRRHRPAARRRVRRRCATSGMAPRGQQGRDHRRPGDPDRGRDRLHPRPRGVAIAADLRVLRRRRARA